MERARVNQRPKKYSAISRKRAFDSVFNFHQYAESFNNLPLKQKALTALCVARMMKGMINSINKLNNELGN